MGIWNSDIINGDATLECAMQMLTAAGIGPAVWPPTKMEVGILMSHGLPIVTRLGNYDEYFACLEKAKDHHEALEANIHKLITVAMKIQTITDKNMHLASGEDVMVGHAMQVLALILMRAGAYFPPNFEVTLEPLITENDPFTTQAKNPIRKLVMAGFKKLVDEYAIMSNIMLLHVSGRADHFFPKVTETGELFNPIPGLSLPFDVSGVKHITITRLLYKQPHPMGEGSVMIWQGDDDDAKWIEIISRKFENVKREPLTRKLPVMGTVLEVGKQTSPEQIACAHALHLKETECKYATDEQIEKENGPLAYKAVRIYGLNARPDLNGKLGVATSFDKAKGRYKVVLVGTSPDPRTWPKEQLGVKPGNLVRLDTTHDSLFLPEEPPEEPMID